MGYNSNYPYCSGEIANESECPIREDCRRYTTDREIMIEFPYMKQGSFDFFQGSCKYFDPIEIEDDDEDEYFSSVEEVLLHELDEGGWTNDDELEDTEFIIK